MSTIGLLNDSDLHGLVDGHIEATRRADVLRRLASSPADRARVEAWQDQNDLIRTAFFGIEKEPIPVSLRLVAPPTLHCVPAAEPALVEDAPRRQMPLRQQVFSIFVGILLVVGGIGGGWMLIQPADDRSQVIDVSFGRPGDDTASIATRETKGSETTRRVPPLATSTIPDLSSFGLIFTSAETLQTNPSALVFHYRNPASDNVKVIVTPVSDVPPTPNDSALSWRAAHRAFSISGTIGREQLQNIATLLRAAER